MAQPLERPSPPKNTSQAPGESPLRWRMLALVWLLYASFGLVTGTIPPLVEPILHDLHMTYSQMGLVLGAWQLVYIVTASPMGALVDRLGPRRSLAIGAAVVWLSLVARGLAIDFVTLFLAVALFGIGGPIISIGAPKIASVWFRGKERALAVGIYSTSSAVGTTISLATASSVVMPLMGTWRAVSIAYGVPVLLFIAAWLLWARDPAAEPLQDRASGVGAARATGRVFGELVALRTVRLVLVLAAGTFLLNHALNGWLPTLLQEGGMDLARSGIWSAAATASGALSVLVVPRLAPRGDRRWTMGLLLLGSALTTAALAYATGPALWAVLLASAVLRTPLMPVATLILMDTRGVGAARMGAAGGLFFAAAEVGGFSGPFMVGMARDVTGSLRAAVLLLSVLTLALVPLAAMIRKEPERPPDRSP